MFINKKFIILKEETDQQFSIHFQLMEESTQIIDKNLENIKNLSLNGKYLEGLMEDFPNHTMCLQNAIVLGIKMVIII